MPCELLAQIDHHISPVVGVYSLRVPTMLPTYDACAAASHATSGLLGESATYVVFSCPIRYVKFAGAVPVAALRSSELGLSAAWSTNALLRNIASWWAVYNAARSGEAQTTEISLAESNL